MNTALILDVIEIGSYVIAIASVIVKFTPSKKDDKWLGHIVGFLKFISLHKRS